MPARRKPGKISQNIQLEATSKNTSSSNLTENSRVNTISEIQNIPLSTELEPAIKPDELLIDSGEDVSNTQHGKTLFIIGLSITCIVIVISVYIAYISTKQETMVKKDTESKIVITTPTPTVVLKPLTVEVLNGSGIRGKAGRMAEKITDLGYDVIIIGNTLDTEESGVYVTSDISQEQKATLLKDLETLINSPTDLGILTNSTASARIIIGSR